MRVGIISDTHGLLRPEAILALNGSDHILHAGDMGDPAVLARLRQIAPVTAIRGNIDRRGDCSLLPSTEAVELCGRLFYLVHALADLDLHPVAAGISVVVSGHSHRADVHLKNDVLYVNPGGAGPKRFSLPATVAIVTIAPTGLHPQILTL